MLLPSVCQSSNYEIIKPSAISNANNHELEQVEQGEHRVGGLVCVARDRDEDGHDRRHRAAAVDRGRQLGGGRLHHQRSHRQAGDMITQALLFTYGRLKSNQPNGSPDNGSIHLVIGIYSILG